MGNSGWTEKIEELQMLEFLPYDTSAKPVLDKDENVVIYARIASENGNIVYINSDGVIVGDENSGDKPAPTVKRGDINADGKINLLDAQLVLKAYLKIKPLEGDALVAADVNRDGKVNLKDAQTILKVYLKIITLDEM